MSLTDAAGLAGVVMIVGAYAAVTAGRLDPKRVLALLLNLAGAGLVLVSLSRDFNLSAALMEGVWALVALAGLIRLAIRRRP